MEENKEVNFTTTTVNIPEEYKPISAWGYFGYQILFSIPCVGFIFLCIFALGGTKNKNLKNFARSYFIVFLLTIIICAIFITIAAITGISLNYEEIFRNAGY